LVVLTLLFAGIILGFSVSQNLRQEPVTLSVPAAMQTLPPQTPSASPQEEDTPQITAFPININTATKEELMLLPGIGEVLAQRVIRYREEHGGFASVTELKNVEGIGEKRLMDILDLVTTGG